MLLCAEEVVVLVKDVISVVLDGMAWAAFCWCAFVFGAAAAASAGDASSSVGTRTKRGPSLSAASELATPERETRPA